MWLIPSLDFPSSQVSECSTKAFGQDSNTSASATAFWVMRNGTHTLSPASWRGWARRPWSVLLFGATVSPNWTPSLCADESEFCLRVSHAPHSASPESNSDSQTNEPGAATIHPSRNSCGSFPSVSPPWCSSKMSRLLFEADTSESLERNFADWVTRSKCLSSSLLNRLARAIAASASSSSDTWPTPNSSLMNDGADPETFIARREALNETMGRDTGMSMPLGLKVMLWPSPRSEDSERCGNHPGANDSLTGATMMWATPKSSVGGPDPMYCPGHAGGPNLKQQVELCVTPTSRDSRSSLPDQMPTGATSRNGSGRRLNPAFVNFLQGNPWWWTRAEPISFAALEISAWRLKLRSHVENLCEGF